MFATLFILTLVYALMLIITGLAIAEGVTYRDYQAIKKRRQRITEVVQTELEGLRKAA